MAGKSFPVLLVVTLVAVAGAVLAVHRRDAASSARADAGRLLYPELAGTVNDAEQVSIESAEGTVTLQRGPQGWTLSEWAGYPARIDSIREVLVGLARLQVEEPKTARPESYAKLGVEDPAQDGAKSARLRVRSQQGQTLADLIVGEPRVQGPPGLYVRKADEAQAWLVGGRLTVPRQPSGWVDTEIVRLDIGRVVRAEVRHPDGETLLVERRADEEDAWELRNVPPGMKLKYDSVARQVANAAGFLNFDSVVLPGQVDLSQAAWTTTRIETRDGLVVLVQTTRVDEKDYGRLAFEQVEPAPALAPTATPEGGEAAGETQPPPVASAVEVAAEKAELERRLSPWTYVLSTWKADSLRKRLADLIEPATPGDEADETAPASDEIEFHLPGETAPPAQPPRTGGGTPDEP